MKELWGLPASIELLKESAESQAKKEGKTFQLSTVTEQNGAKRWNFEPDFDARQN